MFLSPTQPTHAQVPLPDVRVYVENAEWLPSSFSAEGRSLVFAHLPREAQRRAVFLDRRFTGESEKSPEVPLAALDRDQIKRGAGPLHFVFHTGFCCSTLLARALDVPGVSMGLKEPDVLVTFGRPWEDARQSAAALEGLQLTLDLLSRPLNPGETQIVKPSNACNHLLPEVLHMRPDAKVLLMHSSLEDFLIAIAKRGVAGRAFARQLYRNFCSSIPLRVRFPDEEQLMLTDLQVAAQVWLMQMSFFAAMAEHYGAQRVRTVAADAFLAQPDRVLARVSDLFGLKPGTNNWAEQAEEVLGEHSKRRGETFDAAARAAENKAARAKHAAEIAEAEEWARRFASHCRAPQWLGDTLLVD